jgi:protein O-GlcNAc transferase
MSIEPILKSKINSVIALYSKGQIQEALDAVETLTKSYPNEALLFNISGACFAGLRQLDNALKSYDKALTIKPDYAEVHYNLGVTLQELGQLNAAVKSYEQALFIKPDYAIACNNLGLTLQKLGQLNAAVKSYEQALAIKPDYADVHNNRGNALKDLGQLDAAVKSYKQALAINPNYADAYNNLGVTLQELGQQDAAVKSFEKALAIKPDFADAHYNLGNVLKKLNQLDAAVKCFEQALAIKPDYADAHNNLGNALKDLGQLDAAVKCYEKAVAIRPDFAQVHQNHGGAMKRLKRLDKALASFERALVLNPELNFLLGDSLHSKMHLCVWDDLPNDLNELQNKINNNEKVIEPFSMLGLIDDPELQRKVAEIFTNKNHPKNHDLPRIGLYPKHKKIRIGYFSADFREHPVSALTAELYEIHDRNHFEIHAFSYGPDTEDKMNLRIKAGVDHFHEVRTMPHKDLAMLVRSLEIDIAVDLGGHTKNARTGIFAMSAAPIQVSYIGYIGTMGADYYDYLVTDQIMIPEEKQHYYAEKIVYLPSFQVNDSKQSPPSTSLTRQDVGLPETGFVFCCFNNTFKITPTTFDSWGRILKKAKGSVLLIYADNESAQINLTKEITLRGIDPSRLIFGKRLSKPEYLARFRVADLFLDTHPYNAGTTASEALRMGLPVLTYMGNSFASRHAASVITALNLPELITTTEEEYESLAIKLATDPEKLKNIKDTLVGNLPIAPLYDTPMFTRHLESAYSMMYDRYQQGLGPDHIY